MWCWVLSIFNIDEEFSHVAVIKGHGGREHGVQHDSETPYITLWASVGLVQEDLRRAVKETAHIAGIDRLGGDVAGEAKISELHRIQSITYGYEQYYAFVQEEYPTILHCNGYFEV